MTDHDYYSAHNKTMFDMVLKEAVKLAKDLLLPSFQEMDRTPPELVDGEVRVHPSVKTILKEFGDGRTLANFRDGDEIMRFSYFDIRAIEAVEDYFFNRLFLFKGKSW